MERNNLININCLKRADGQKWLKFSEISTLTLGAGFLLSGIIFFFAFNWENIHRFIKMGIVLALLLATFVASIKAPMRDWVRKITISSMCVLVGAFWALFGQVYQTGADSYLLFLAWSLCIVVWVAVTDFYPLWLFFMALVMLAYGLAPTISFQLFDYAIILSIFILFFEFSPRFIPNKSVAPKWFITLLFSALYIISVILISVYIFNTKNILHLLFSIAASVCVYIYATRKKNLALYALFFTGVLVVVYILFIRIIWNIGAIVLYSFSFLACVYFLGKHVISKKKEWENSSEAESLSESPKIEE